jgi:hypothetical protein
VKYFNLYRVGINMAWKVRVLIVKCSAAFPFGADWNLASYAEMGA